MDAATDWQLGQRATQRWQLARHADATGTLKRADLADRVGLPSGWSIGQ